MSWAIWITGPPGSGKTSLARATARALEARGIGVRVLELDQIRRVVTPHPTYGPLERDVLYRALGYMARLLTEAGIPVILDATAHRREWREAARAMIPAFAEVELRCPTAVCRARERDRPAGYAPRGIYARGGRPASTVPGIDVPYEESRRADAVIDTAGTTLEAAVQTILRLAERLGEQGARHGEPGGAGAVGGEAIERAAGGAPTPEVVVSFF